MPCLWGLCTQADPGDPGQSQHPTPSGWLLQGWLAQPLPGSHTPYARGRHGREGQGRGLRVTPMGQPTAHISMVSGDLELPTHTKPPALNSKEAGKFQGAPHHRHQGSLLGAAHTQQESCSVRAPQVTPRPLAPRPGEGASPGLCRPGLPTPLPTCALASSLRSVSPPQEAEHMSPVCCWPHVSDRTGELSCPASRLPPHPRPALPSDHLCPSPFPPQLDSRGRPLTQGNSQPGLR